MFHADNPPYLSGDGREDEKGAALGGYFLSRNGWRLVKPPSNTAAVASATLRCMSASCCMSERRVLPLVVVASILRKYSLCAHVTGVRKVRLLSETSSFVDPIQPKLLEPTKIALTTYVSKLTSHSFFVSIIIGEKTCARARVFVWVLSKNQTVSSRVTLLPHPTK